MKKINVYYINDGLDGVIAAKSLKHCIKIMLKNGFGCVKEELMNIREVHDEQIEDEWVYEVEKVPKSNQYHGKKCKFLGFME